MRKRETLKIDDREITVHELRVKDWRKVLSGLEESDAGDLSSRLEELLPLATDLTLEQMDEMAPSELEAVWEKFREVNASFFGRLRRMGLTEEVLAEMFAGQFLGEMPSGASTGPPATSSSGDTGASGDTAGPGS